MSNPLTGRKRPKLVYGFDRSTTRLIHISTAERGKACELICPSCQSILIARKKDDLRAAHFAHASIECSNAPETALHLLCKEIIQEEMSVDIPPQIAIFGKSKHVLSERKNIKIDQCMLESRQENGLVPDIIAVSSSRKLAIEIFVTHKCDEAKAVVLTSCCDAAMEIDASGVNRQIEKEALRDLVISRLPRSWIFNSRVDEACESMRRLHNDREREASEAKEREISAKADRAIRRYIREENSQGYSLDLTMLQFSGLASLAPYIGVDVDGLSGFASDAASWQYHVVGNILLDADDEYLTSDDIYYCLCRDGYVKEWIRKLDGAVIDRMARRYPFTRPSESVTIYLDSLTRAGIVEFKDSLEHPRNRWKQSEAGWRSYRIKPSFVADAIAAAEEKLTAVKHRCAMIDFILSEIRELTGHGFEEICWTDRVDDMTGVKILEIGQSTKFWDDVLDAYERLSHGEALSRADRERIIGRFIELPRDGVSYQHASPEI